MNKIDFIVIIVFGFLALAGLIVISTVVQYHYRAEMTKLCGCDVQECGK